MKQNIIIILINLNVARISWSLYPNLRSTFRTISRLWM